CFLFPKSSALAKTQCAGSGVLPRHVAITLIAPGTMVGDRDSNAVARVDPRWQCASESVSAVVAPRRRYRGVDAPESQDDRQQPGKCGTHRHFPIPWLVVQVEPPCQRSRGVSHRAE